MSVRKLALGLGCLMLVACGAPPPPAAPAPAVEPALRLEPPPVHALLGYRTELELTSAQIEALDSLGQGIHAENQPLMAQLLGAEPRANNPLSQREVLTTAAEIQTNNIRTMEQVRAVLTEAQRTKVCKLFGAAHKARAENGAGTGSYSNGGLVWIWCAEETAHST